MEIYALKKLTFYYSGQSSAALRSIDLSVRQGEFLTICGASGSGKSTLLRQLKTALAPHGNRSGEILFRGTPLERWGQREQAAQIGFVQQSPENQLVTDKVWQELAFGLESMGSNTLDIRRRVAETASFFGMEGWFHKNIAELSGGQKQILNLASVMVMQPSVLILDEPTGQLDPIAAAEFLAAVKKINNEQGVSVILSEHRLEDAFPLSDRVLVMEQGQIVADNSPAEIGDLLKRSSHIMFPALPAAMRIWLGTESTTSCPVTVRDGQNWLTSFAAEHELYPLPPVPKKNYSGEALIVQDIWFKYKKDQHDVIKGLSFTLHNGEFFAVLGGNGSGKSTMLSVAGGLQQAYRGETRRNGTVGILPQNPQTLFVKKTVREDLSDVLNSFGALSKEGEERLTQVVTLCHLENLLDHHPYDLSGGEQQRAALAKVLLSSPDILLLDEPTKGMDAIFKQTLASILYTLLNQGKAILMVSHDLEFCAEYADRCALFFDGSIISDSSVRQFFSGNCFYTTAANRIARSFVPEAVTVSDVITFCGGTNQNPVDLPLPAIDQQISKDNLKQQQINKLPRWRKIIATVAGAVAIASLILAVLQPDLTGFWGVNVITQLSENQLYLYGVLITSLCVLASALTQRQSCVAPVLPSRRPLRGRTVAAAIISLLLIPLTIFLGFFYLDLQRYYFVSLLVLLESMLPFFLTFEGRSPQARELVLIASLCAIAVAGRAAFFMLPQFTPVLALVIISGVALGGESGFLVGAITMLISNLLFGQGPWTPWQMFAMGITGFLAGVVFHRLKLRRSRVLLSAFGALAAFVIYGGIMNPAAALMYSHTLNWKLLLAYYIAGFPMDCIHALATVLFLWLSAEPMLEKLERIKTKYGLLE